MSNFLDLSRFKVSSINTNIESADEKLKIDYVYSAIGWFFISFFGTTWIPKSISFTCIETNEVFEHLTDKELIKYYMLYSKK